MSEEKGKKRRTESMRQGINESMQKGGASTAIALVFVIFVEFVIAIFLSLIIFGVVVTYEFIMQSYLTPFWVTAIMIFVFVFGFTLVGMLFGKKEKKR